MKTQFIVTIEGDWNYNGKKVTQRQVEKDLREAVKEQFEFLANKVTVKVYIEQGDQDDQHQ